MGEDVAKGGTQKENGGEKKFHSSNCVFVKKILYESYEFGASVIQKRYMMSNFYFYFQARVTHTPPVIFFQYEFFMGSHLCDMEMSIDCSSRERQLQLDD